MSASPGADRTALIFADLVARLFAASTVPMWGSMAAGALVAAAHWGDLPPVAVIGWSILILVPTVLRLWLNAAYRRAAPVGTGAIPWARRSALLTLFAGILWGVAGLTVTLDQNMVALVLTVTTIQALIMGGVVTLSPYLPSFFAFALPSALPLIIAMLSRGEPGYLVLAGCNLLFLLLLTSTAVANNRALRRLLALTYEKQDLIHDLTTARRAAEEADRAKSSFLAVMSHELRTPITGLLGMADLLAGTPLDVEQRRWIGMMRGSARTLLTVLNDILDFTKIEAGKMGIEEVCFDPRQTLADTVELYRPAAEERGLALTAELDGIAVPALLGDPVRLRQVLANLLDNALKFTERGGVAVTAWTETEGDRVVLRLQVADTGIGMSAEELGVLFHPFTQADRSTTRRYGGTGLGLAICRRLLQAMDGDIDVDSRPGFGTVFRIHIRACAAERAPAEPVPAPTPEPAAGSRLVRVLLAEDNPTNRELITTMLGRLGFAIDAVANGADAVEAVRGGGYDIVLMDVQMPVLDGVEATRAIRALAGPSGRVPIVGLSADLLSERRRAARAAGMTAYLGKPVDWPALVHTLRRLSGDAGTPPAGGKAPVVDAPAAPVLNAERMADLLLSLGADTLHDLLDEMVQSARAELDQAREAAVRRDLDGLRRHAHTLKGLAANFGADRLADAARQLQAADANGAVLVLADVEAEIDAAVTELDGMRSVAAPSA